MLITARANASPARSFAKTVTWRILGSLDTFALGWLITGNLAWAGSIASAEVITKMVLYYLHERTWSHIRWGDTVPAPLPVSPGPGAGP